MNDKRIRQIIREELTKNDVNNIVQSKLSSHLNSNELKKKVKEITADVVSNLFKILWQRDNFWKGSVK